MNTNIKKLLKSLEDIPQETNNLGDRTLQKKNFLKHSQAGDFNFNYLKNY